MCRVCVRARVCVCVCVCVLQVNGTPAPITRAHPLPSSSSSSSTTTAASACCLLVHRIPDHVTDAQIRQMLVDATQVVPVSLQPICRGGTDPNSNPNLSGTVASPSPSSEPSSSSSSSSSSPSASASASAPRGRSTVEFSSQLHAQLAFDSIPGPNRPDKQHREQKRIYFKGGGYLCIRKV